MEFLVFYFLIWFIWWPESLGDAIAQVAKGYKKATK